LGDPNAPLFEARGGGGQVKDFKHSKVAKYKGGRQKAKKAQVWGANGGEKVPTKKGSGKKRTHSSYLCSTWEGWGAIQLEKKKNENRRSTQEGRGKRVSMRSEGAALPMT